MPQPTRSRLDESIGRAVEAHAKIGEDHRLLIRVSAAIADAPTPEPYKVRVERQSSARSTSDPLGGDEE
jgi:hypothetical protein